MSNYLVAFVSLIYLVAATWDFYRGNYPMAMVLCGYTIANIGLILMPAK